MFEADHLKKKKKKKRPTKTKSKSAAHSRSTLYLEHYIFPHSSAEAHVYNFIPLNSKRSAWLLEKLEQFRAVSLITELPKQSSGFL